MGQVPLQPLTVPAFQRAAQDGHRPALVTCYDSWSARLINQSPVDAILVGDSVAMVMHGFETTLSADLPMMVAHTAAVARGAPAKLIIADVPFPCDRAGRKTLWRAADALLKAGAHALKIEGAGAGLRSIRALVEGGVPVMGHLGLTPQHVLRFGGYQPRGRSAGEAQRITDDAQALQDAGCFAIVLECVPAALAAELTAHLAIPTIGIGAGPHTTGQILVLHDLLGADPTFQPRFVRRFGDIHAPIQAALAAYCTAVGDQSFPAAAESYS
jgi:3-methyl-2-oxobutanoate hydroxymethyltransferase